MYLNVFVFLKILPSCQYTLLFIVIASIAVEQSRTRLTLLYISNLFSLRTKFAQLKTFPCLQVRTS